MIKHEYLRKKEEILSMNDELFFLPLEELKKEIMVVEQYLLDLKEYVQIVKDAPAETLQQIIVKEYAYLQDTSKVATKMNQSGFCIEDHQPIEKEDIVRFIKSDGNDLLHRIIRSNFFERTPKTKNLMAAFFYDERPNFIKWK